jgi:hypothetical protein
MFDDRNDVGGVAATRAFGVIGVDSAVLEGRDGGFDKARFVQSVGMYEALNIVVIADASSRQLCLGW